MTKRRRIALLVETSLGSGREILRGISNYAGRIGTWEMFHAARGLEDEVPSWIESWQGDGVIARIQSVGMVKKLKKIDAPVVDVLGVSKNPFPLVHVDDEEISRRVAQHFFQRGFRHFGFYGIDSENWSMKRQLAFAEAVKTFDSFSCLNARRGQSEGSASHFNELQSWLRDLPKPVAVMVCSDQRGLLLLEACRASGMTVPEQVSVVGVDNDLALCEISTPNLSSVRGGHYRVGLEAAALLDRLMQGKAEPRHPLLVPPNNVVVRESSDSRSIDDPAVRAAVQFMREHLSEPITAVQIAQSAGVSKTRLQVRFRASLNTSLRDYLTERRIERAMELIGSTDLTFTDIAQRCGFKHHEYLGYVLKKERGVTPRQLRVQLTDGERLAVGE